MEVQINKQLQGIVRKHKRWLKNHGDRVLNGALASLQSDFDDGSVHTLNGIGASLGGLATYYGIQGTIDVINESIGGWAHIANSLDLHAWNLRIRAEFTVRQSKLGTGRSPLTLTNFVSIAACLACVSEQWEGMAETILRRIDFDPVIVRQSFWQERRFEPFVLKLLQLREGQFPVWEPNRDWMPYRRIVDAWDNETALKEALHSACEYHCQNIEDRGFDWDPEFKHSPFDLLPCEVMLVRRMRAHQGLPSPDVPHDLVSALDIKGTTVPPFPLSDISQRVKMAYDKCYPDST